MLVLVGAVAIARRCIFRPPSSVVRAYARFAFVVVFITFTATFIDTLAMTLFSSRIASFVALAVRLS
jgi:hypothetical protein